MKRYIDLTHTLVDGMCSFGDDPVTRIQKIRDFEIDGFNLYRFETCMHAGTHIDIPMHITGDNRFVSEFSIERFCGKGILIDVEELAEDGKEIQMEDLLLENELENKIVLLRTGHFKKYGTYEYFQDYPIISMEVASLLSKCKIKALGIDTPSPDKIPFEVHKLLLMNDISIIENIANLGELKSDTEFEVFAFPLKIEAEASLVRLVARIIK